MTSATIPHAKPGREHGSVIRNVAICAPPTGGAKMALTARHFGTPIGVASVSDGSSARGSPSSAARNGRIENSAAHKSEAAPAAARRARSMVSRRS